MPPFKLVKVMEPMKGAMVSCSSMITAVEARLDEGVRLWRGPGPCPEVSSRKPLQGPKRV